MVAWRSCLALYLVTNLAYLAYGRPAEFRRPPPAGPHINLSEGDLLDANTFAAGDTTIATTYFYWYESRSGVNIRYADGRSAFRHTPTGVEDYSYLSVDWHKRQLRDMVAAGIDVVLPVYWGDPTHKAQWSFDGLKVLVQAQQEMIAAGERPPKIGMFHACISLSWGPDGPVDLRTELGKEWFYTTIRDFWAMVPPSLWAMVEGKPLIFLYSASFAKAHDQTCIDHLTREFAKEFAGRTPYIVRGDGWDVETDSRYSWGAAAFGPHILHTAAIGPGYDDSVVPGRKPIIVDREGGAFYVRGWQRLLRLPPQHRPRIVHIETWNELHEATQICETKEFGRLYIDLTRQYSDMYREGVRLPRGGSYARVRSVWCAPGPEKGAGLSLLPQVGDGPSKPATRGGRACRLTTRNPYGTADYLYFDIHDSFAFWEPAQPFSIRVWYFDDSDGIMMLQYDSSDPAGSVADGAFKSAGEVQLEGTQTWRSHVFRLDDARFSDRTHGGDFRIACVGAPLAVGRVSVTRGPSGPAR